MSAVTRGHSPSMTIISITYMTDKDCSGIGIYLYGWQRFFRHIYMTIISVTNMGDKE
jgi:hypothetical protein